MLYTHTITDPLVVSKTISLGSYFTNLKPHYTYLDSKTRLLMNTGMSYINSKILSWTMVLERI